MSIVPCLTDPTKKIGPQFFFSVLESNKWNKVNVNSRSPDPRYGHFAFMYKSDLYIYGGITVIGAGADIWKYNERNWTQIYANNPEKLPSGLSGSACVLVANRLYVFGGRNTAGQTVRDLNVYDLGKPSEVSVLFFFL